MSQRWPVKVPEEETVPVICWVTPQVNERISISFLCLLSLDSPSSPSTFRYTSDGMAASFLLRELALRIGVDQEQQAPCRAVTPGPHTQDSWKPSGRRRHAGASPQECYTRVSHPSDTRPGRRPP